MTTTATNWKAALLQAREKYMVGKFAAVQDFGPFLPKPYEDKTTNGLTRAVMDWLKFNGHYANRINNTGRVRLERVEMYGGQVMEKARFIHGAGNIGTADIDAIINGKPVKIEIKCKATNDRLRPEQAKERARIEAAGGVYIVVADMESFVNWYTAFIAN